MSGGGGVGKVFCFCTTCEDTCRMKFAQQMMWKQWAIIFQLRDRKRLHYDLAFDTGVHTETQLNPPQPPCTQEICGS